MLKSKIYLRESKTKLKGVVYRCCEKSNVIKLKNSNAVLTDEDINYLFTAIVGLIKTNATKTAELKYKKQILYYKNLLNINSIKLKNSSSLKT
ncbi:MAG: hypothetical protein IKB42_01900 [Clostridia bacterium]|nr:hypothetical protein [Clostridia bacterium]